MMDMKQKATSNKPTKNRLLDIDNKMAVTRWEGQKGKDEVGKEGQVHGDGRKPDFGR